VKNLLKRFKKLDTQNTGTVDVNTFLETPELAANPIAKRALAVLENDNHDINYFDFIRTLGLFYKNSNTLDKLECTCNYYVMQATLTHCLVLFSVYDVDGDGYVSKSDMFSTMKLIVGPKITDANLNDIVDKTITAADEDKDEKLSVEEFKKALTHIQKNGPA